MMREGLSLEGVDKGCHKGVQTRHDLFKDLGCDLTLVQQLVFANAVSSACRETPLRVRGCLLASLLPLDGSRFIVLHNLVFFYSHRSVRTTSRINLFRLNERIDRGPAISSVCHSRSLGLLNPYLSVFRVPIIPSVLPRSLRTVSRTASATRHVPWPLGWMPISLTPSWASACRVAVA